MRQQELSLNPADIQKLASDPSYSVFVSASAGTGKTKILCDRFLRLMLSGAKASNIFCVTFTNAAAKEMEERIRNKLLTWQTLPEYQLTNEIKELTGYNVKQEDLLFARDLARKYVSELSTIKIQTLHSFCTNLLSQNTFGNDLPKEINVLDTIKSKILLNEAFSKAIEAKTALFLRLTEYTETEAILNTIKDLLTNKTKLHNFVKNFSHHDDNLRAFFYSLYQVKPEETKENILEVFWKECGKQLRDVLEYFKEVSHPKETALSTALASRNFLNLSDIFLTEKGSPNSRLLKKNDLEKNPSIKDKIEFINDSLLKSLARYKAIINSESNFSLVALSKQTLEAYEELKEKSGLIDYEDLLTGALELLTYSPNAGSLLFNLDYQIDHILVDEAQDLSELQWDIIKAITGEFFAGEGARNLNRTVFIVGDYKQSIYSFQGADPDIFLQMCSYFKKLVTTAKKLWREINLEVSFRSTAPVLQAVDKFFNLPEVNQAIGPQQQVKHLPFRKGKGRVRLLPLARSASGEKKEYWILPVEETCRSSSEEILAHDIAKLIYNWLEAGRCLPNSTQSIKPSDILILVRKRSNLTKSLSKEFFKLGIPCFNQDKILLNDQLVIKDLLSLAKFVISPNDDLNLACLLKSPLVGITEEELSAYCASRGNESLFNTLKDSEYYLELQKFIDLFKSSNSSDFFYRMLETQGKRQGFVNRFGDSANIIIDAFLKAMETFFNGNHSSLLSFIDYLDNNMVEVSPHIHAAQALRIMTCHAAKGLQAPIVILADSASSEQSPGEKVIWYKGIPIYSVLAEFDNELIRDVKNTLKVTQKSENYRLLYVAMTRAQDELYIAGWDNNRLKGSWYTELQTAGVESTETSDDFILPQSKVALETTLTEDRMPTELYPEQALLHNIASRKVSIKTKQLEYGEIMHELIRLCISHPDKDITNHLASLKNSYHKSFSFEEISEASLKAKEIVSKFSMYLTNGMAEVPIYGKVDNATVSARIDWLQIKDNIIRIIDFKTDKEPNERKPEYIAQLRTYHELVREHYQTNQIECYLLWVSIGIISRINF